MKKLLIVLLLFSGYLQAQDSIKYTPMTAAGYRYKYLVADSGFNVPFGDTAIKRGSTRPGALICFTGDNLIYRWNGLRWIQMDNSISNNCVTELIDGSIIWVSGFNFSNTVINYRIGCRAFQASASNFSITAADTSDRYTIVWADTLGNIGTTDGTVGAVASIPNVNPQSQILLATYLIPANSSQPQLLTNTVVYKENVEWVGFSTVPSADFAYTINPYQGLLSTYLPTWSNGQYVTWNNGIDNIKSEYSYISFYIRLSQAFSSSDFLTVVLSNNSGWIGYITLNSGQGGFNGSLLNQWQLVAVPVSSLTPTSLISNVFTNASIYFSGTGGGAIQIDNFILQSGGNNQSSTGVSSVNGQTDAVTIRQKYNSDSTFVILEVNGVDTDSLILLKDTLTAGANIDISTVGNNHTISSTGGGGSSQFRDTTGNDLYLPDTYPNLGLGTINPTAKLHLKSSVFHEIQLGETLGAFTDASFFSDMNGSPTNLINFSRSIDGVFTQSMFNFDKVSTGQSSTGFASRDGFQWVTNVVQDNGMSLQNGGLFVGVGTAPVASARLEVSSTTQGVLLPRMTNAQMLAISSPATGLFVYNTDSLGLFSYDGSNWRGYSFGGSGGSGIDSVRLKLGTDTIQQFSGGVGSLAFRTQQVFNVNDYGAVGDNSTNNDVAFAACMSAVVANGGGVFYVPEGVYRANCYSSYLE